MKISKSLTEEGNYMKKKSVLATVILCGICAIVWCVRIGLDIVYKTYNTSVLGCLLTILCAIIWIVAFILNLRKYRSPEEE